MPEKRRFLRVAPRGLAPKSGKIFSGNLPPAECRVVDLSAGGACLELSGAASLPRNFELVVGAVRKKCKVVWRAGWRVGVSF